MTPSDGLRPPTQPPRGNVVDNKQNTNKLLTCAGLDTPTWPRRPRSLRRKQSQTPLMIQKEADSQTKKRKRKKPKTKNFFRISKVKPRTKKRKRTNQKRKVERRKKKEEIEKTNQLLHSSIQSIGSMTVCSSRGFQEHPKAFCRFESWTASPKTPRSLGA